MTHFTSNRADADLNLQEWLHAAYQNKTGLISQHVQGQGYSLPSLDNHQFIPLDGSVTLPENIVLRSNETNKNNWLVVPAQWRPHYRIIIGLHPHTCNNLVVIGKNCNVWGEINFHNSGGLVICGEEIGQASLLDIRFWSKNGYIFWGKGSTSNGVHAVLQGEYKGIVVGDDCMFANNIFIRNSDMHGIVDMKSGEWLNSPSNVVIEPHVWVGQEALIMKGIHVGFGSIIGAKALVNKNVPAYSIAAGVPAKIVKTDVSWDRLEVPRDGIATELHAFEARIRS
jgi:hypothetical protein